MSEEGHVAIVCWSGDQDKMIIAMTMANSALALGRKVSVFFTYWGLLGIQRRERVKRKRGTFCQEFFRFFLPRSPDRLRLSRYHFAGIGSFFYRRLLKEQEGMCAVDLIESAKELGGDYYACIASMDLMGISREELIELEPDHYCGMISFLEATRDAQVFNIV